jgi:flagellar biosynthesis protein FliP
MEEQIELNFVYSKDASKVKEFLGNIPRSIECINYMDIVNKLTKNDYYQFEPSDAVVSSYLIRQIQIAFERDTLRSLFYVLGNLDELVINNVKGYVSTLTDKSITFNLYYSSVSVENYNHLFNDIIEFE